MPRLLRNRLIFELNQIRDELVETVSTITPEELDYAPREGMKSYRAQLVEIGAMQAETATFLTSGSVPRWEACEARVRTGSLAEILVSLDEIKLELTGYLMTCSDEDLASPQRIPDDWESFFGTKELEREELVRWVARHEYYHLGQIIANRWMQGHNPYRSADVPSASR